MEGFDPSVEFINLDGDDDLGPPPDLGPSPIACFESESSKLGPSLLNEANDSFDDLEDMPPVGPASIIIEKTNNNFIPEVMGGDIHQTTATLCDDPTSSSEMSDMWHCAETFEVKWDEDDFSGNLKSANEYKVINTLGSGSFASVYQVERQKGDEPYRKFALKCACKSRLARIRLMRGTGLDMIKNEISIMRNMFHRNVVLLFEVLDQYDQDSLGLVLELCKFGTCMDFDTKKCRYMLGKHAILKACNTIPQTVMNKVVDALKDSDNSTSENADANDGGDTSLMPYQQLAGLYFRGLVKGLRHLHSLGIAHRDIKPDNLLIYENGTLRIADFGCARKVSLPSPVNGGGDGSSINVTASSAVNCDTISHELLKNSGTNENDGPSASPMKTPSYSSSSIVFDSIGTEVFYSPEICKGNGYDIFQADIWAAGCCLCCFMNDGMLPFDPRLPYDVLMKSIIDHPPSLGSNQTPPEYFHHLIEEKVAGKEEQGGNNNLDSDVSSLSTMLDTTHLSDHTDPTNGSSESSLHLRNLMLGLLEKDPLKRMTLEEAENHSWLSDLPPDTPPPQLL